MLAECFLFGQVFFLHGLLCLKVGLMTLAHHGAGFLETVPYFVAEVFGHRACLLPFLMEVLQLVDGCHHVFFGGQCLGLLTEFGLYLQVLAEIIVAELMAQFQ